MQLTKILLSIYRPMYSELYISPEIENETIMQVIRLRIKSMSATSGPPIGPVLGQYAIPISAFCTDFNERSSRYREGVYVFVTLYHYADGSYNFDMYAHVSSMMIKRAACLTRGFGILGSRRRGAVITAYQLFEAIGAKCALDGYTDYYFTGDAFYASGVGTAQSMGLNFLG